MTAILAKPAMTTRELLDHVAARSTGMIGDEIAFVSIACGMVRLYDRYKYGPERRA